VLVVVVVVVVVVVGWRTFLGDAASEVHIHFMHRLQLVEIATAHRHILSLWDKICMYVMYVCMRERKYVCMYCM
jgi:hypothetical protein